MPNLARPWPRPGTEAPSDWTCGLRTARPLGITLQLYVPGRRASAHGKQPKKPTVPQPREHSNIRGPTPVGQTDARQAASHWGHEATVLERPPSLATPTSQGVTSATRAQITSVLSYPSGSTRGTCNHTVVPSQEARGVVGTGSCQGPPKTAVSLAVSLIRIKSWITMQLALYTRS